MSGCWDPDSYLRFGDERTRPAADLVTRIKVATPRTVADLGCGPGNSTAVLRSRWPRARLVGVDNSPEMIAAARTAHPDGVWLLADIAAWQPEEPFDVVFSNAALQWVPDHASLVRRLFEHVAPEGVLAFQLPSADFSEVRSLIREIAQDPAWRARMDGPSRALTMESPAFYYAYLAPSARSLDIWQTEYLHVMPSHDAILEWISSTGLRPFLEALETDADKGEFVRRLRDRIVEAYEAGCDGRVLFPFRRLFVVAYR
jgi:trans-aconitate 2-methyltransferase